VPRRVSLPGADELFRTTGAAVAPVRVAPPAQPAAPLPPAARIAERVSERLRAVPSMPPEAPQAVPAAAIPRPMHAKPGGRPGGTGRTRHDEKITVYVSSDELLSLEHARLILRAEHGIAVDRGRIVREAIAELLADLQANGEDSLVVRRLQRRR
jgi:hypothetical protein